MSSSDEKLQEAKSYFSGLQPSLLDKTIHLRLQNKGSFTLKTSQLKFDPNDYVVDSLDASTEGVLANPLQAYLNELIVDSLELKRKPGAHMSFALCCRDLMYPLEVLYLSPELLVDHGTQHGQVVVVKIPKFFPFAASAKDEQLAGLKEFLIGKGYYFSADVQRAIPHLKAAIDLEPKNALYLSRYAAALLKSGNSKEAIKILVRANKLKPGFGKVYLRLGLLLYNSEPSPKYQTALVTLHGGVRHGFHRTRQGGKAFMLARKCVAQLWGASAFQSSAVATQIPCGVLQMIFDYMSAFDVLRCSEVCFTYYTFATVESYWKRRLIREFGSPKHPPYNNKWKNLYRERLADIAPKLYIVGICEKEYVEFKESRGLSQNPGFVKFPHMAPRFLWSAFLRYLGRLGVNPAHFPAVMRKQQMLTIAEGAFRNPSSLTQPYNEVWTLAGACLNSLSKITDTLAGDCVLLRAGGLGSELCQRCFLPTTNIKNKLPGRCIRGHSGTLLSIWQVVNNDSFKANGVTDIAKKLMLRRYRDQEKQYGFGFKLTKERQAYMYSCCGSPNYVGSSCCALNHVALSRYVSNKFDIEILKTAHGTLMTKNGFRKDIMVSARTLQVVSPLREFDPYCGPYEVMHMNVDDLKARQRIG